MRFFFKKVWWSKKKVFTLPLLYQQNNLKNEIINKKKNKFVVKLSNFYLNL